jgi:hypothetical protein
LRWGWGWQPRATTHSVSGSATRDGPFSRRAARDDDPFSRRATRDELFSEWVAAAACSASVPCATTRSFSESHLFSEWVGFSARSRPLSDLRLRLTIAFTRFKSPGLLSLKLNALVLVSLEASDQVEQLAE